MLRNSLFVMTDEMPPLHPQAAKLAEMINARQVDMSQVDAPFLRFSSAGNVALQGEPEPIPQIRHLNVPASAGSLPVRLYLPDGSEGRPLLVYLHGGGFVFGDLELYDRPCRILANACRCGVASVNYRQAPETKFPGAIEDAWAAFSYFSKNASQFGLDQGRIGVAGDSSGGFLAAVTCLYAMHGPQAAGSQDRLKPWIQILMYPEMLQTSTSDFPSRKRFAKGFSLTEEALEFFHASFLKGDEDPSDWRVNPLGAEATGLPPAFLAVASHDPLHDEGVAYARHMEAADVPVRLVPYEGQMHGFFIFPGMLDASRQLATDVAAFIEERLAS
jgi:acetyl esterase